MKNFLNNLFGLKTRQDALTGKIATLASGLERLQDLTEQLDAKARAVDDSHRHMVKIMDNIEGIGMWQKGADFQYVYANRFARDTLLGGRMPEAIYGRTDAELLKGADTCMSLEMSGLTPRDLPHIRPEDIDASSFSTLCNVTDEITKEFGKPCKFLEWADTVDGVRMGLYVYKTPIYTSVGTFAGLVGAFKDVTASYPDELANTKKLVMRGQAFKIDDSPNYYISQY